MATMDLASIDLTTITGERTTFADVAGKATLVVNVASKCGFTPQYEGLERLWTTYRDRGLMVLGFPTNQFLQERRGEAAIAEFCRTTYGVTFPMFAKVHVNGRSQHPLFKALTAIPDDSGDAGRVAWNFEKFLLLPGAARRFRSKVEPEDPQLVAAIEAAL